jgi:hypothetical protein
MWDQTVRFWRLDWQVPSTWVAPVTVENGNGNYAMTSQGGNNGPGRWPYPKNSATQKPINDSLTIIGTTNYTVGASVQNSLLDPVGSARAIDPNNESNFNENYGPATIVNGSAQNTGIVNFRMNYLSLGVFLPVKHVDNITVVYDTRYPTIMEYLPHLWSTYNGLPYIVAAGTPNPYNNNAAWSSSHPVNPYGVPGLTTLGVQPSGPAGGAYVRFWRYINNAWSCVSAGHQLAVPGTPTINNNQIVGDPAYASRYDAGLDAGKIFGGNVKCNGANLLTGPDGAGGVVLKQGTSTSPNGFNITVNNIVHGVGFHNTGGVCSVDNELMLYDSWTSGTSTLHIVARGQGGTSTADHSVGAQIAGLENNPTANPGCNMQVRLPVPFAVRHWPLIIGPTWQSVSGAPTNTYP